MSKIPMVKSPASAQTRSAWFPNDDQSRNQRPVLGVCAVEDFHCLKGNDFRGVTHWNILYSAFDIGFHARHQDLACWCHCNTISGCIRLKLVARQTRSHSPLALLSPRKLNCRNPKIRLIQPLGASEIHLRSA